jgi:hypothetical protein
MDKTCSTHGQIRNEYKILTEKSQDNRPRKRYKPRWKDNIKRDLRERGYELGDWFVLAYDRFQWELS